MLMALSLIGGRSAVSLTESEHLTHYKELMYRET